MARFTSHHQQALAHKRILITGGAGFIGSCLIRLLLKEIPDCQITNLDLLTYAGNLDNLTDIADSPRYRFVHGDIQDAGLTKSLMKEVDFCINVAAQTHVDRSISSPEVFVSTNVLGTATLLQAAKEAGIQKFVQVSTDEVYGSLGPTGLFHEVSPLDPSSPYSASKASADLLALSYFKTFGLPVCITRCSNNYGPYQYPEKLIPLFILNASQNKPVPVYGDGMNVRDWIHVEDHAEALVRVLVDGTPGEIYNVGASMELPNLEITRLILKYTGKDDSLIQYVEDRLGHDRRYAIDSSKIQNQLGWMPSKNFEDALKETVEWYLTHPDWVKRLQERLQDLNINQEAKA
jgi:dTDP-glucose 4,6-dehydratase